MFLAGFRVLRKLTDGASAELFLAQAGEQAKGRVIVEVIRPELFDQSELTARYLDEARVRRGFVHPNVARRISEGTTEDGRPYLVTEIVGESLAELLSRQGPLDVESVIKMAIPLCEALHFLHQQGQVHGNLNPTTIFVAPEGPTFRPKLIDFGLALFRPGRTLPRPPGRILVPPEYLAPERVRGQRATVGSDIYALGVLMYEALTGAPPFSADDSVAVRRMHLESAPAKLPKRCEPIAAVIERCLLKSAEDRFATAADLREALALQLEGTLPLPVPTVAIDAPDSDLPPAAGDQVGRYTLVEPVGEGAMGRVFLARHTRLGRTVALKLLKPEHARNRDHVERFVREARAVNRIRNDHIVEIFDLVDEPVGRDGRRVYCVMEFLSGSTLGELMLAGPVPLLRAVAILRQVARALGAAHSAGVVHRDIKPDNIFVGERHGRDFVKVVDFGVAKLRDAAELGSGANPDRATPNLSTSLTADGILVGTPAYMAPEQISGRDADTRLDIYALGVVLYRLLSGVLPFASPEFKSLLKSILEEEPPALPMKTPTGEPIPPRLASLVRACLSKDPAHRPADMEEIHDVLASMQARLERREKAFRLRATAFGAVAAVLMAVGIGMEVHSASGATSTVEEVRITVRSSPDDAEVVRTDTGEHLGRTPLRIVVHESDRPLSLKLSRAGWQDADVTVRLNADAQVAVNLAPEH